MGGGISAATQKARAGGVCCQPIPLMVQTETGRPENPCNLSLSRPFPLFAISQIVSIFRSIGDGKWRGLQVQGVGKYGVNRQLNLISSLSLVNTLCYKTGHIGYSDSAGKPKKCHCKRLSLYPNDFQY